MSDDKKQPKSKPPREDAFGFDDEDEFSDEHLFEDSEFEAEGWSIPHDPESVTRVLKSLEGLVPGILKRASAYSNYSESRGADAKARGADAPEADTDGAEESGRSSEGFRARLGGTKLPREVVNFILAQVDTTKREFLRIASNEVRVFLESVDLGGEVAKILTTLSFEVRMEVRFIPNDQALKPSARGRMRVKRNRAADEKARRDAQEDKAESEGEEVSDAEEPAGAPEEEMPGLEFADVFKPRRWSLRRRPRPEDDEFDAREAEEEDEQGDEQPER